MKMKKYTIGLDFGTKSGRAVLVDVSNGRILAAAVKEYTHGVMDKCLPDGVTRLGVDWCLQNPIDYIEVLETVIPSVMTETGVHKEDVIGISMDFTACTILPIYKDGTPLCTKEKYIGRPHAYVKLWKHHAAQEEADRINSILKKQGSSILDRLGGRISSEILLPKVWQILNEDPEIYNEMDEILEAPDWLNFLMTGAKKRSISTAGYKAMYDEGQGYPAKEFFGLFEKRLENLVEDKLSTAISKIDESFGSLNEEWAEKLGLLPGTAVGTSIIDAHAGLPGCGITKPGQMMLIIGTSSVQTVLSERPYSKAGIMGGVKGGIMPGYYALESGLAAVGDQFEWFVNNCVPEYYYEEARNQNQNIHQYLTEKAQKLAAGQSGLIALDWWNGNKTPYTNSELSGVLIGLNINTKPEEIYRAFIEATAYGTRLIMDMFEEAGVGIDEIFACGGIAHKNSMLMQIYSDVTNREIKISAVDQTAALGAAMYAAVAAGSGRGGYDSIFEAAEKMSSVKEKVYKPDRKSHETYSELYEQYKILKDMFNPSINNVLIKLHEIKKNF